MWLLLEKKALDGRSVTARHSSLESERCLIVSPLRSPQVPETVALWAPPSLCLPLPNLLAPRESSSSVFP